MMAKIPKGKHKKFTLPCLISNKDLKWRIRFDDSARYNLHSEDQYDWNKLTGIHLGVNYSIRLGWRYNPVSELIELCFYYHLPKPPINSTLIKDSISELQSTGQVPIELTKQSGNTYYTNVISTAKIDEMFLFQVKAEKNRISSKIFKVDFRPVLDNNLDNYIHTLKFKEDIPCPLLGTQASLYFGGNQVAPHDIYVSINKL